MALREIEPYEGMVLATVDSVEHFHCCIYKRTLCGINSDDDSYEEIADEVSCIICNSLDKKCFTYIRGEAAIVCPFTGMVCP